MHRNKKSAAAAAIILALAMSASPAASAASGYEHINYSGAAYGGTDRPNVSIWDDEFSSVRTYGLTVRFYTGTGYTGNHFTTKLDWSNLSSVSYGLPWGNWNDRISSWDTAPLYYG